MSQQLRTKAGSFGTFAFNKKLFFLAALISVLRNGIFSNRTIPNVLFRRIDRPYCLWNWLSVTPRQRNRMRIHHKWPASVSLVYLLFFSFKEHINHETTQYAFRFLGRLLFSKIFEKKAYDKVLKCHLQKPSEYHFAQRPSWSPAWSCHLGNENKSNEVQPAPPKAGNEIQNPVLGHFPSQEQEANVSSSTGSLPSFA